MYNYCDKKMTTTIRKWGNSLGVRIPQHIAQELEISDGSQISISINEGIIEISKVQETETLESLLSGIYDSNLHSDLFDSRPEGNEAW